jgi:hypothetical protein
VLLILKLVNNEKTNPHRIVIKFEYEKKQKKQVFFFFHDRKTRFHRHGRLFGDLDVRLVIGSRVENKQPHSVPCLFCLVFQILYVNK